MEAGKGLVGGIQRFSTSDGPGIRTTIFLKGCPLNCSWCHNPELITMKPGIIFNPDKCIECFFCEAACSHGVIRRGIEGSGLMIEWEDCKGCQKCTNECVAEALSPVGNEMTVEQIMEEVLRDKGFYEKSGGGVTLSGGELLSQSSFAEEIMDSCIKEGVPVVIDTSGFGASEVLLRMAEKAQKILYDMKIIDPEEHQRYTGQRNELILRNLEMLAKISELNRKIIMRMPLIHGINDTENIISRTRDFYVENHLKEVTLLPYHELGISKARHLGKKPVLYSPPSHERLLEIVELFACSGIETSILGEEIYMRCSETLESRDSM